MRRLLILSAALMLGIMLVGCHSSTPAGAGGRDGAILGQEAGYLQVSITWPARPGVDTAVIPAEANSILVTVADDPNIGAPGITASALLVRPAEPPWTTTAVLDSVPPASGATLMVTAHESTDGTGEIIAWGTTLITIPPGGEAYPTAGNPGDPIALALQLGSPNGEDNHDPALVGTWRGTSATDNGVPVNIGAVLGQASIDRIDMTLNADGSGLLVGYLFGFPAATMNITWTAKDGSGTVIDNLGAFQPINFTYEVDVPAAGQFTMTRDTISAIWVKQ
ncbi:MAG TPA: hypothetical protein DGT21_14910 [Armatimonadetes bacterium]|nr:hypothetical protein [Armatimonadota bacterium]